MIKERSRDAVLNAMLVNGKECGITFKPEVSAGQHTV